MEIRKNYSRTEILMLSVHYSDELIDNVVNAGIRAYILKSDAVHDLELAVKALANHRPFFTKRVTQAVSRCMARFQRSQGGRTSVLSPREQQVLVLVAEGTQR